MNEKERIVQLEKMVKDMEVTIKALEATNAMLAKKANADEELVRRHVATLKSYFESSTEQLMLFNDAEATAELGSINETGDNLNVKSYVRRKARNSSIELPPDTPVIDVYDDSPVPSCPRCGSGMKESGEKVYETFSRISCTVVVRRHVKQYSCTRCTPDNGEGRVTETPVTGNMLDGTICDPTLLANIIANKYQMGLPLYRQQKLFEDVGLSRFTMSSWLMKVGGRLMENMEPLLEEEVYSHPLVNMDETPLKVIDLKTKDGKGKAVHSKSNAFMVVRAAIRSDGGSGPVIFTYRDNRRNKTILELIGSYGGALQTDGLAGYSNAKKRSSFKHLGCLVHARRKAVDANGGSKSGAAFELMKLYAEFFHNEGELRDRWLEGGFPSDEAYVDERRTILTPLLDAIFRFCEQNAAKAAPRSALRIALAYPLSRKDELYAFLDVPCATSSNQTAENAIRPFVVGRKNFLFCITETGAEVSAFLYSLVESCKALDINVEDYLTWLFLNSNSIKDGDADGWRRMLPGKSDISSGKIYRESLRLAVADPDRKEPYKLRGKRV